MTTVHSTGFAGTGGDNLTTFDAQGLRVEKIEMEIKKKQGGKQPGSGRKRGTPNKLTATVKMMVMGALEKLGGEKYLIQQAKKHPQAFMTHHSAMVH
jgi:hypothetical protein